MTAETVVSNGLGELLGQLEPHKSVYTKQNKRDFSTFAPFCSTCKAHPLQPGQRHACPQFPQRVLTGDDAVPTSDADDLFSPVDPFTCLNVSGADSGLLPLNLKIAQQ